MKRIDIDTLLTDALISEPQHAAIIDRYGLDAHASKLGAIFAMIGAVLCVAGVALVISANWAVIPRLVKVAASIALLTSFHAGGVFCTSRAHPLIGAALHVAGGILFLLAIALVGQIYNLSSRPPNAILLWTLGICALPWVLQSRAQFLLLLAAFILWLMLESDATDSLLYIGKAYAFFPAVSWIGALLLAWSALISFAPSRWRGNGFEVSAESVGTVMLSLGLLVCVLGWHAIGIGSNVATLSQWSSSLPVWLTLAAVLCVMFAAVVDRRGHWASRTGWALGVCVAAAVPWVLVIHPESAAVMKRWNDTGPFVWVASGALFCFALLQIQRGLAQSSRTLINSGIAFVALNIAAVYFRLFGSMMNTGITFVITGALLVVLAWLLERWRQRLNLRLHTQSTSPEMSHE